MIGWEDQKKARRHLIFILLLVSFSVAYILGWKTGPGPYIPSEDSFDYTNHHCVVKGPENAN